MSQTIRVPGACSRKYSDVHRCQPQHHGADSGAQRSVSEGQGSAEGSHGETGAFQGPTQRSEWQEIFTMVLDIFTEI